MEDSTILNMIEYAIYHRDFIVDVIVSDNDSKMRSFLKHPLICFQVQVLTTSKGKIDEEIPEPSILADPSHRVKVVAKHIFYIINGIKAQRCGSNKTDAL